MTFTRLLLRNLISHWRGNLAVLLGVVVGAAVLTGALLVGDSLRGSLRAFALDQLGWVDDALVSPRFLHEEIASQLPANKVSPAILMQGSAARTDAATDRADKVAILAVDDRFWPSELMPVDTAFWKSGEPGVALNAALADRLQVKVGEALTLFLQSAADMPRESLMGKRGSEDVLARVQVNVKAILPDRGMARFTLRPSASPPRNAFVPLRLIQDRYDPDLRKAPLKGRVNVLLVGGATGVLSDALREHLTLDDWGLVLRTPADRARAWATLLAARAGDAEPWDGKLRAFRWQGHVPDELAKMADSQKTLSIQDFVDYENKHHGYLSLESAQLFVDPTASAATTKAAQRLGWQAAPALVYLIDTIQADNQQAPYAVAAALDPRLAPPLGPIQPLDQPPLQDDQVLVARWPGCPLELQIGQAVTLRYYVPDAAGQLQVEEKKLRFAGWVPLAGAADDADLTPRFEGITDKLDILQWENPPFPFDRKRLRPADSEYWKRYRTTPKVFVTLATGQKLWGGRYGDVTSFRIAPATTGDFDKPAAVFCKTLLEELPPAQGGLVFQNIKQQALTAGAGSNDFGMLFLGFSSFLIVAALLLVGLMVRLNLDRRAKEIGLLLAVGWRRGQVRRLVLAEGAILAALGGLIGVACAIGYAGLLLDFLGVIWPAGLERSFLQLHVTVLSCVVGWAASLGVSVLTIWWATRMLAKVPASALLAGETVAVPSGPPKRVWVSVGVAIGAVLFAVASTAFGAVSHDQEARAGSFFTSGMFVLIALLALLWAWMRRSAQGRHALPGLTRVGIRNAARHPVRSLLTAGLLASASFLVVAVEAFHRDPGRDFLEKTGGSGGFAWVAECSVPIFQDLNAPQTRADWHRAAGDANIRFIPFRVRPGEDASCLNLYQPLQPRILGVPRELMDRGGFHFAASEGKDTANPWQLLLESRGDGAIPAIGEKNTVEWVLHSGLGKEIEILDGRGQKVRLRIVALLEDSVFQSELLIADGAFLKLFPREEGFQFFLVDAPPGARGEAVRQELQKSLAAFGYSMTPAAQRLQSYLDVENTYLATFQALGGLGLLLGTMGLAVVLVRSVWERRGELALLRALGFRRSALGWLVLAENAFLLVIGLAIGSLAALAATAPFLASQGGGVLRPQLLILLAVALAFGLGCGALAVTATLRIPLLPALRRD